MADRPAPPGDRATLAQELFESERFAAHLAIERQHLRDALDAVRDRERGAARAEFDPLIEAARRERDQARAEAERLAGELDRSIAERDRARVDAHDARAMLDRVTSSTAWRLTGPARRVLQAVLRR